MFRLVFCALVGAATAPAAFAQEEGSFYLRTGVGVSIIEDVEEELSGVGAPETYTFSLTPGVRVDLAPGYNVNNYLAVEFNTGVIWNGFDELEGPGGAVDLEGDLLQVPLLANVIGRYPIEDTGLVPFFGAGGGGVLQYVNIDRVGGMDVDDDSDDDVYPAFQVFGGLLYQIAESWSVGLVYKYLYVFSGDDDDVPGLGRVESDDSRTHSISAVFSLNY